MPVKTAVREGLQAGASQWALVKSTPVAAKRSRFGVLDWGCPPRQPTQSLRSSMAMNKTFGGSAAWQEMVIHKIQEKQKPGLINDIDGFKQRQMASNL